MTILEFNRQAHVAFSTVKESVSTTKPTDSTSIAVILILVLIIKEVALEAGIFAEANMALLASCLYWLAGLA